MKILLDPGHDLETPGKRSPDGLFLEYEYNRTIASRVTVELLDCGYDASLLVPEISDIPLVERCRRVNAVCDEVGAANVILVSIHVNAAGSRRNLLSKHSPRPTLTGLTSICRNKYQNCWYCRNFSTE
ncbi:MAG: N-acetylmuramoyl-L-alanine amidase [Bacteroidales bacterium]|nr:N-acetylmuramoyl-L-alanine amidase [Bacteroidales bacterium]